MTSEPSRSNVLVLIGGVPGVVHDDVDVFVIGKRIRRSCERKRSTTSASMTSMQLAKDGAVDRVEVRRTKLSFRDACSVRHRSDNAPSHGLTQVECGRELN